MTGNRTNPPRKPIENRTVCPDAPEPCLESSGDPSGMAQNGAAPPPADGRPARKRRVSCPLVREPGFAAERNWPTARYFQVHFEHTYAVLEALHRELEEQRYLIGELLRRVERRPACTACRQFEDGVRAGRNLPLFPDRNN